MRLIGIIIIFILLIQIGFSNQTGYIYPTTVSQMDAIATLTGNGKISNLFEGQEVKIKTITFPDSILQEITVLKEELYINGKTILPEYVKDEFGNKYVNFSIPENGEFNYILQARIKTNAKIKNLSEHIGFVPEEITKFKKATEKVESDSEEIINVSKNKFSEKNYFDTLTKINFWVNQYVSYAEGDDFLNYYLSQKSAKETLLERKGVCDEFANLAAGLLRVQEIPTRMIVGITYDGSNWGNHAWIETYNNGDWFASDPTFGEVGFVDGTHIKLGSYDDISNSLATAIYPSNASVLFNTQQKLPDINIQEMIFFDKVEIEQNKTEIKTKQWNQISFKITNKTEEVLIAPIRIHKRNKGIFLTNESQQIILKPRETKEVFFDIYSDIELEKNQYAKITITINTLSKPIDNEFIIRYADEKDNGKIIIKDITPIKTNQNLILDLSIINYKKNIVDINIDVNSKNFNYTFTEPINPFTEKKIRKTINEIDENYLIKVTTPQEEITKIINIEEQIVKQTIKEEEIEDNQTKLTQIIEIKQKTPFDELVENPMTFIIIFITILIIFSTLFYLIRRKKYV
jgi:hypothetical protein